MNSGERDVGNKHIRGESGFTLVEVLITTVLVGILATSILALFSTGMVQQRKLLDESKALYIAQQGMELVFADRQQHGFATITADRYPPTEYNGVEQTIRIQEVAVDRKRIVVKVTWNSGSDSLICEMANY